MTNLYTDQGDPYRTDYSDGTPSVTFTNYNRSGQPRTIIDAAGQRTLAYDYASRQVADNGVSGLFSGITVSNHFNGVYGRDYLQTQISGQPTMEDDYAYDTYGRLSSASYNLYSAAYGYLANSDLVQSITSKNNGSIVLAASRSWQYGTRLQSIANLVNNVPVSSHNYAYDVMNRRTRATLADNSAKRGQTIVSIHL